MVRPLYTLLAAFALFVPVATAPGEDVKPIQIADVKHEGDVDFEKEILPIFRRSCLACHNASDAESDLVLETPQTIAKGGAAGPTVEPGKGLASYLLKVASFQEEPYMPPPGNERKAPALTPEELGLIKLWIDQGAKGEVTGHRGPVDFQPLPPGVNPIFSLAITEDGQFAAAGRANQIFIYHIPTGALVTRLTDPELAALYGEGKKGVAHLDLVQSLTFNPEGDLLASGGFRTVKLWRRPRNTKALDLAGAGGDEVQALAVSADQKLLATAGKDKQIKIWDLSNGKTTQTLAGHGEAVTGLAFTADGSKLVSSSLDKSLRVWNVADGKQLEQIDTPSPLNDVALAMDDTRIATGGEDKTLYVYQFPGPDAKPAEVPADAKPEEAKHPLEVARIAGHGDVITSLSAIPAAKDQIASGSRDGNLRVWNLTNNQQLRAMGHGGPVIDVAVRADGKRLASVSENNTVKLWNGENGQQVVELKGDILKQRQVASLDRNLKKIQGITNRLKGELDKAEKDLPTKEKAAEEAKTKLDEAEKTLKEKQEAAKEPLAAKEAAAKEAAEAEKAAKAAKEKLEADKKALEGDKENEDLKKAVAESEKASQEADKKLEEATKKLAEATKKADEVEKQVMDAQTARDASQKALEFAQKDIERAKEKIESLKKEHTGSEAAQTAATESLEKAKTEATESEKPMRSVAFSPDGTKFVAGGDDNLLHTYDAEAGTALEILAGHGGIVLDLAFTGESTVASASADKNVVVWELNPEWKLERTIGSTDDGTILVDRVIALDFSPDGKLLATGSGEPSRSGQLKLWKVEDGTLVKDIPDAHSDTIFDVEFSDDGKLIASGAADKFAKIWNVETGEFVRSFEGHTHHVLGVSWQSDGTALATAGADNVIKVWNVETGDQTRTIQGYNKQVTCIEFIGDTNEVISASGDGTVRRHRVDNGGNVRSYGGFSDFVYAAAATPDAKIFIAAGQDSTVRVWQENGQELRSFAPPEPETPDQAAQAASSGE